MSYFTQAYDNDEGQNAIVQYFMSNGNDSLFEVSTDGSVHANMPLPVGNLNITAEAYNPEPYIGHLTNKTQTLRITVHVSDNVFQMKQIKHHEIECQINM